MGNEPEQIELMPEESDQGVRERPEQAKPYEAGPSKQDPTVRTGEAPVSGREVQGSDNP
jgi:hypothetical protein